MFTTLEHLEHHIDTSKKKSPVKSFLKEMKTFSIFFVVVFIVSNVVVNAQLYQNAVLDIVSQLSGSSENFNGWFTYTTNKNSNSIVDEEFLRKKMEMEKITQSVDALSQYKTEDFIGKDSTTTALQENLSSYNLDFNTLPPTDRVIIPKINVNTPFLQSSFNKHIDSITKEDFDKDLYHGVVQYPTTPYPGMGGNTLIFWHTSYESWKKNPYATIFSQIAKLVNGDVMQVVYKGKLYEYEVIGRSIVNPDKVNEEYMKYQNGNYLTLLGCYPIGSDKQRILIIGQLKQTK